MADALRVDVGQSTEELVDVELDLDHRHGRLHLVEEPGSPIDRLGYKFLDEIKVDFVFLLSQVSSEPRVTSRHQLRVTYPLAIGVIEGLQLHNVGVPHNPHDLQFTVLHEKAD